MYACHISLKILSTYIHINIRKINVCGKPVMKSKGIYKHKFKIMVPSEGEGRKGIWEGTLGDFRDHDDVLLCFLKLSGEVYTGVCCITILFSSHIFFKYSFKCIQCLINVIFTEIPNNIYFRVLALFVSLAQCQTLRPAT